jgi:CRISPR system Cascade subunit CasB
MVLIRRLGFATPQSDVDYARVSAVIRLARVLAHVDEHDSKRPMQAAGWKSFPGDRRESEAGDDRPVLAEVRFRRLLQVEDGEEQVDAFIRLIKLLGRTASVPAVARDFLHWNDKTKQSWAFDYYAAGVAAPSNPTISDED